MVEIRIILEKKHVLEKFIDFVTLTQCLYVVEILAHNRVTGFLHLLQDVTRLIVRKIMILLFINY
jgi:hypothetical protein